MSKIKRTEDGVVDIDHMLSSIDARIKAASSNIVVGDIDSIVNRNDRNTNPPADAENTSASVKKSEPVRKQNPYINRDPVNVKNKVIREIIETDDESEEEDGEEILLTHQMNDSGPKAVQELRSNLGTLISNIHEIKMKYGTIDKTLQEISLERKQMVLRIDTLEEENHDLANSLKEGAMNQNQQQKYVSKVHHRSRHVNRNNGAIGKGKSENLRKALTEDDDDDEALDLDDLFHSTSWFARAVAYFLQLVPFKNDIRQIQAKHGASVASYFVFSRFMYLQFIVIAMVMAGLTALHIYNMKVAGENLWKSETIYSSYLPKFLMYHSYSTGEGLLYTGMSYSAIIILGVSLIEKMLREDRLGKEISTIEAEDHHPFATDVLGQWDLSLTSKNAVEELQGSIANTLLQKLHENRVKYISKSRTYVQLIKLYAVRFLGLILYLAWQSFAFAIIIVLTIYHEQLISQIPIINRLKKYSSIVVNLSLTAIGSVTPEILKIITLMEGWDSAQVEVNLSLFRLFLSNQLNVLLFVLSYMLLADPYLFSTNSYFTDIRGNVQVPYISGEFNCRMDSVEYQVLLLALTTWVTNILATISKGYMPFIKAWIFKTPREEIEQESFDIVESMVNLLNFAMIEMLRIAFAPQTLILTPIFLYVQVKVEKWIVYKLFNKPKRPWKAQKAGMVFSTFYLMSFIMVGFPVLIYFYQSKTFPKDCNIQDSSMHICSDALVNDVCTVSTSSNYFTAFSSGGNNQYCYGTSVAYPKCICQEACGPFVGSSYNLVPLRQAVASYTVLNYFWIWLIENPLGAWLLALCFFVAASTRKNTIKITVDSAENKVRNLETHIASLEAEKKKNAKLINKLKAI